MVLWFSGKRNSGLFVRAVKPLFYQKAYDTKPNEAGD